MVESVKCTEVLKLMLVCFTKGESSFFKCQNTFPYPSFTLGKKAFKAKLHPKKKIF